MCSGLALCDAVGTGDHRLRLLGRLDDHDCAVDRGRHLLPRFRDLGV